MATLLTQQRAGHTAVRTLKVFAQDETRLGLLPIVRHRITACGVQPTATVRPTFDSFSLYGAVEPTTGASFFLELPHLSTQMFQVWVDGFAAAFPASLKIIVLDHGAFHQATALCWPANTGPVFLPP